METVEDVIAQLLPYLDAEPSREGLEQTPLRYEKFLREFLEPEPFTMTTFNGSGYKEMVVQTQIPFYSLCEHHLVPFFGHGSIAYIPSERIVGLSKLARTLDHFSRRLQNQERITIEVADFLTQSLQPKGVGVILHARHLCMEMRGIQKNGATTTTSCLRGVFKSRQATRSEFLQLTRT